MLLASRGHITVQVDLGEPIDVQPVDAYRATAATAQAIAKGLVPIFIYLVRTNPRSVAEEVVSAYLRQRGWYVETGRGHSS